MITGRTFRIFSLSSKRFNKKSTFSFGLDLDKINNLFKAGAVPSLKEYEKFKSVQKKHVAETIQKTEKEPDPLSLEGENIQNYEFNLESKEKRQIINNIFGQTNKKLNTKRLNELYENTLNSAEFEEEAFLGNKLNNFDDFDEAAFFKLEEEEEKPKPKKEDKPKKTVKKAKLPFLNFKRFILRRVV